MRIRPQRRRGTGKYGAIRQDGFDSRKEQRRHAELRILERAGEIRGLNVQVSFPLLTVDKDGKTIPIVYPGSKRPMTYRADFTYEELDRHGEWAFVVEDAKGCDTRVSKIKRAILAANTGINVRIT